MKKTEHYGLNQWDLPDRVRMEDFNADNAKIEGALSTLNSRFDHLNDQMGDMGGQMAGFATTEKLEEVKAALENADAQLQNRKLEYKYFNDYQFVRSGSNFIMDVDYTKVKNTAIYCMLISIHGMGSNLNDNWYLNPVKDTGIYTGKCLSTLGNSSKGIAVLDSGVNTNVILFPMYTFSWIGAIALGDESSIGGALVSVSQLKGFALTPASGSLDSQSSARVYVYTVQ